MGVYTDSAINQRYKKNNALLAKHYGGKTGNAATSNSAMHPINVNRTNTLNQMFNNAFTTPSNNSASKVSTTGTTKSAYTGNSGNTGIVSPTAAYSNVPNVATANTTTANTNQSVNSQYNLYQQALAQQRQNALNAYNRNSSAINSMYGNRLSSLDSRYAEGKAALDAAHTAQQESIRRATEEAQRQAYISSMVAERDLEQNLSAQGLSGGASESTLAKLRNNYANNRNSNEKEYLNTSTDLGIAYQSELANLESQYQQLQEALEAEKAQAIIQNENALANSETSIISQFMDYANSLDYLNASSALNLAGQEKMAALNQQYALEQMAREQANKVNYTQFENNLSANSSSNKLRALKNFLKSQGYSDAEIASRIVEYS